MTEINLNFQTFNTNGDPYFYKGFAGQWFAEVLYNRISTDNPSLEAKAANSFRANNTFVATDDEALYLKQIIINTQVDNLFKSQLLSKFTV